MSDQRDLVAYSYVIRPALFPGALASVNFWFRRKTPE